jgi:hypothetical protein
VIDADEENRQETPTDNEPPRRREARAPLTGEAGHTHMVISVLCVALYFVFLVT